MYMYVPVRGMITFYNANRFCTAKMAVHLRNDRMLGSFNVKLNSPPISLSNIFLRQFDKVIETSGAALSTPLPLHCL